MATVLITGTNRGLGLEFVKQFLQRGDRVLATCRNPDNATDLSALASGNDNLQVHAMDVGNEQSMVELAQSIQNEAIDIFINNAGIYGPRDANFGNLKGAEWEEVMRINSIAPLLLTQLIIGSLRKGADKKLVYITSKMGSIDDNKGGGSYIYRSSKTALNSAVKSLSVDLADEGFSVGIVHPGWVRTDMGGPNGLIDPPTSVSGMIEVIDNLNQNNSGQFFNYDGSLIPW